MKEQITAIIGIDTKDALEVSAKTGKGVEDLLEMIINKIPAPKKTEDKKLKALIIDSWFDNYFRNSFFS